MTQLATSTLSHSASRLVTLDDLALIPGGPATRPRHRPVPHLALIEAVTHAFDERGYAIARQTYSVSHDVGRAARGRPARCAPLGVAGGGTHHQPHHNMWGTNGCTT